MEARPRRVRQGVKAMEARPRRVRQGASDDRGTSQGEREDFHPIESMEAAPASELPPAGVDVSESTYLGPCGGLQSLSRRNPTPSKGTRTRKKRYTMYLQEKYTRKPCPAGDRKGSVGPHHPAILTGAPSPGAGHRSGRLPQGGIAG
jgi:hypothetical protein